MAGMYAIYIIRNGIKSESPYVLCDNKSTAISILGWLNVSVENNLRSIMSYVINYVNADVIIS